jgi:hypothetical protein
MGGASLLEFASLSKTAIQTAKERLHLYFALTAAIRTAINPIPRTDGLKIKPTGTAIEALTMYLSRASIRQDYARQSPQ